MTTSARDWANALIAVPKSLEAQGAHKRVMNAERRAADAEQAQTAAEREIQRQEHLIAMMLDQVGGSLTIDATTMERFDVHRMIRTQVNLNTDELRVWVEEVAQ